MLVVGLLVLAEWRAPNGSVMALKLQRDRFQAAAGDGSMRPRLYPGRSDSVCGKTAPTSVSGVN